MPALPTTAVYIATSLDGFIARPNGALDWLPPPSASGEDYGYAAFMATVEVLVMGRNTFDVVCSFGEWPYADQRVVVLTTRPLTVPTAFGARVEARNAEPAALLAQFAAEGVRKIYLDGGLTIQRFLAANLVDELILTRVPVLLGAGIPLFGLLPHDLALEHLTTTTYAEGLVQSHYRVKRP